MRKKIHIAIFVMLLSLFVGTATVYASDMAISKTKITVNVGDTYDLDITGTEKIPRWTSWNVNTVKVNQDGEVTALRTGKTTVSARVGLSVKKCTVTVVGSSVKLNKSKATIYAGGTSTKTVQLKATVKGASKAVEWTSDNPEVATVDSKGKVTSVSAGKAIITAKANDKTASCEVTVKDSSISLNMNTMQLSTKGNGSSIKLTPTIVGSKKSVKWTTSNKKVAVVSGGKVTGKGTGTATITATANGVSTTCEVTVVKGSISISSEKELLYTGETKQLKTNAGKKDVVTWISSNEAVATVDEKGKVTTVGAGTAVITASLNDTTDTCLITVKDSVMSIEEDSVALKTKGTDKTYTLDFNVVGRKSTVKWTTSNKNIATVSKGKITAKKAGTVIITATANGISDSVEVTVSVYDPTIKLNQAEYILYTKKGNTYTLKATVDGPTKKVTYTSSNPEVATVNAKGKITAVGEGQTVITATANGVSAECVINVIESKVNLERYNIVLDKGEKAQIPVDIVGYSQTVKYASTNSKVVTVKNGTITAKKYGEADIKVTANGVTSICHVTVAACEHTYDEGVVTKEPLCDELGVKTFTCTLCGDTYIEDIPFTGHNFSELLSVTDPTCTEQGYSLYICHCGEIIEREFKDALGHDWGDWTVSKDATEEEEGEEKRICNRCEIEETNILPKKEHEHVYDTIVTEPTCEEKGYTTYICKCLDTYTDNYVDELGHNWGNWEVTKEPTETEVGEKKRTCGRCQEEETEEVPVTTHEHVYESKVIEPTCTESGYTEYTCECGDSYKDTYVDALDHDWGDWETIKEATETEVGTKKRVCGRCEEEETEDIPVITHKHIYTSVVTEPTCTEGGYTTYTCGCGDEYVGEYVDALGCEAGEWIADEEFPPTCTQGGWERKYCIRCEKWMEDNYLDPLGHDYQIVVTEEPTCTEKGKKEKKCTRCNDSMQSWELPAAHSYDDNWTVTKEPSSGIAELESDFGTRKRSCTSCGNVQEQSIINIELSDGSIEQVYGEFRDDMAYETFTLTNELRKSLGLNELTWKTSFLDITKIRGAELSISYSHNRPNGEDLHWGENIGVGFDTADEVMTAWKNSSGHYANLVESIYTDYAAACFVGDNGTEYWIQIFYGVPHTHSYEDTVTTPTCTEQGYTTHTCSCGDSYVDTYVEATGHSYEDVVTAPTCKDQGYTTHTCSCGDSYVDTYVDVDENAHTAGEWVTTLEPTYTEVGTKTQSCTACGKILETEEIPVIALTNGDAVYTIELAGGETTTVIGHYDTELAADLVSLVNAYRSENNLSELTVTDFLQDKANIRGYQTSYYWEHRTPAGQSPTALYSYSAENLAWYVTKTSALEIFNALKDCEDHNAIMLSTYSKNRTAVSVFCKKVGENDYEYYWVQIFK